MNTFNGIELDRLCLNCNGTGKLYGGSQCDVCDGDGYALTDDGAALAAFIRRHGLDKLAAKVASIEEWANEDWTGVEEEMSRTEG